MSAHQYYLFDVLFMRVVFNRAANRIKLGDFSLVAARVKTTGQTSFAVQRTKSKCKKTPTKIRCQATCRSKKFATEWARIDWVPGMWQGKNCMERRWAYCGTFHMFDRSIVFACGQISFSLTTRKEGTYTNVFLDDLPVPKIFEEVPGQHSWNHEA